MIHPQFLDHLKARVAGELAEESQRIAGGMATDWPDYRHRTGILKGLGMLAAFIDELTKDKERK